MTAPRTTEPRHRTSAETDNLLYAIQRKLADALGIPVSRLSMNKTLLHLAIVGDKHFSELVDEARGS